MWSALRSWMVDVCWHCGGTYSLLQAHLGGAIHARLVSKMHRASLVSSADDDGDRVCLHDQCQTLEWWLTTAKDQSDQSLPAVWPASFDHRVRQPLARPPQEKLQAECNASSTDLVSTVGLHGWNAVSPHTRFLSVRCRQRGTV